MRIVVETFLNPGEPSSAAVRVRPSDGQFEGDFRVWCSNAKREAAGPNKLFLVDATWVLSSTRKPQLRVELDSDWQLITWEEALNVIAGLQGRKLRPPS
jgi:hypothetical protein